MRSLPSIFTIFVLIVFGVTCLLAISESDQTNSGIDEFRKAELINKYVEAPPESHTRICYPMNVTVDIPYNTDPEVNRLPRCAVLPRCGGCCDRPQLKCLPTSTTNVNISVNRVFENGTRTIESVSMEVHTACQCRCDIKESDCNTDTHQYDSSACSCQCKNKAEADRCKSPKKMWNRTLCRCVCRHLENCLDDEVFDFETCKCQQKVSVALNVIARAQEDLTACDLTSCKPDYKPVLASGSCVCRPSFRTSARSIRQLLLLLSSPERGNEKIQKFNDGKKNLKNAVNYAEVSNAGDN